MMNSSMISEFVLLGLTNTWELELFFFFIFLLAYAAIMAGNLLIVVTIALDSHLHSTPMYFLLGNLSFLDMSVSTITTPKMVADFVRENKTISLWGCMAQMFFLHFLGGSEMTLLIVMAVDRYFAICKPLHYTTIMNHRVLRGSVLLSWAVGFVHTMSQMVFTITLPFCGPNIVDNIFCDLPLVIKLACTETYVLELLVIADSGLLSFISFILLLISYTVILVTFDINPLVVSPKLCPHSLLILQWSLCSLGHVSSFMLGHLVIFQWINFFLCFIQLSHLY